MADSSLIGDLGVGVSSCDGGVWRVWQTAVWLVNWG